MNRLCKVFLDRNPYFNGKIALIGHSLGSLIIFDLLLHQPCPEKSLKKEANNLKSTINSVSSSTNKGSLDEILTRLNLTDFKSLFEKEKINVESFYLLAENDLLNLGIPLGPRKIALNEILCHQMMKDRSEIEQKVKANILSSTSLTTSTEFANFNFGLAGTGQPLIKYPNLEFKPSNFFALGSPIPMFLTVRGIENLGTDFKLPTCDSMYNIFHPVRFFNYKL